MTSLVHVYIGQTALPRCVLPRQINRNRLEVESKPSPVTRSGCLLRRPGIRRRAVRHTSSTAQLGHLHACWHQQGLKIGCLSRQV
jgi:hypothetical protein